MIFAAVLALIVASLIFAAPRIQRSLFYPKPRHLPEVVSQDVGHLLVRLQTILETNAPAVAQLLRPGLSSAQISALEKEGGFILPEDLRALYLWRNGMRTNRVGLIPGHEFPSLEEVVRERVGFQQQLKAQTLGQRTTFSVFAGHRKGWLTIFPDGAGDGYFFDPARTESEGAFFYNFSEVMNYRWFPKFRNFLAGTVECFETQAFRPGTNVLVLDEDFDRSQKIWDRFAENSHPTQ
jgi:cell wall assembly regulator SMI1